MGSFSCLSSLSLMQLTLENQRHQAKGNQVEAMVKEVEEMRRKMNAAERKVLPCSVYHGLMSCCGLCDGHEMGRTLSLLPHHST